MKGSWIGPGRLHLVPHVNAPVADFPVRKIVAAHHFLADLTLPYGHVLYDYNKEAIVPRALRDYRITTPRDVRPTACEWFQTRSVSGADQASAAQASDRGRRHPPFMDSPHIAAWLRGS